jgi:hypothetical protein
MPSSSRGGNVVLAIAAALSVAGCSSSAPEPQHCQSDAECSSTARCLSGACVANGAPLASVELPGLLESNLLLTFDGSSSVDPDYPSGDSIVSHAWAFRAIAAGCEAPVVAGTGPSATVRFACPGTYAVDLTVTDEMAASAVATREFEVGAYSGPTLVEIAPDLTVQHACTTGPDRCTPVGTIVLSATPTPDAPADLTFEWTVEPPADRPLDANRRVTFDPGPDVAAPTVLVETDGQAISGDWVFHLVARDAAGVVAASAMRLSIGNRAPVVTEYFYSENHAFDGTSFTASGFVSFTVVDPDGDALLDRTLTAHHANDGAASVFSVTDKTTSAEYAISVPYSAPADAAHLIGGAGLERSITYGIRDVNGAATTESWPIVVGNRPPVVTVTPAPFTVDHLYSAVASAYEAEATLSTWIDPDGDPILAVPGASTGDAACAQLVLVAGVAHVSCSVPFAGAPAAGSIAGSHAVTEHVKDPWAEAATAPTVTFTIANRPPAIAPAPTVWVPVTGCSFTTTCCDWGTDPETGLPECLATEDYYGGGSTTVTGRWSDPDGDPLDVTLAGESPQVCTPGACAFSVTLGGHTVCGTSPISTRATTASDGVSAASAALTFHPQCI